MTREKKKNVLVLIPINPKLNPRLIEHCRYLVGLLPKANPDCNLEIIFDSRGPGKNTDSFTKFVFDIAKIRNEIIGEYLKPHHDYVFWIDADLVSYPTNLISELIRRNPTGVSAPIVLYEGHGKQFYDFMGFIENGKPCRSEPPYFSQTGPIYELDGVGCIYLIPADIYSQGAKHQLILGFTEHLSVCKKARELGRPVLAYQDLVAVHAFAPFWDFSFDDNFFIRKIKRWRAKLKILKTKTPSDISGFVPVPFVFKDSPQGLDKLKKFLYVARYFPTYLIHYPLSAFNFLGLVILCGPAEGLQAIFDFIQLRSKQVADYKFSREPRSEEELYDYLAKNKFDDTKVFLLKEDLENLKVKPRLSLVVPIFGMTKEILKLSLDSVKRQIYPNWELCLANGSEDDGIKVFLENYCQGEERIKIKHLDKNLGISENSNEALKLATGDFVLFLDDDDELTPNALLEIVKVINLHPEADLIYSDEDKINLAGDYCDPFFKSDWSPELLLNLNYICHLTAIRLDLIKKVGNFKAVFDGAQDHDLFLRITEITNNIFHIPEVLYHWRMSLGSTSYNPLAKPESAINQRLAIEAALMRRNIDGQAGSQSFVSIIIPTKDQPKLLEECVRSILEKTTFPNYEILIIDNNSQKEETEKCFKRLESLSSKVRVIDYPKPFNYSAINNFGVKEARGDIFLFLNDDTRVIGPDWLSVMVNYVSRKEVGIVGAKLLYLNGTIQHAGVIFGSQEGAGPTHAFAYQEEDKTYFDLTKFPLNFSAVTGACLMIRKEVFSEIGGFDEDYEVVYSDIDLCFKVREKNYRVVYVPGARLYHLESATRGAVIYPHDNDYFSRKWQDFLAKGDPYYNPNFIFHGEKTYKWRRF